MDLQKYFSGRNVKEITLGQSGASVFEVDGKQIVKYAERSKIPADRFDTYRREALFYQEKGRTPRPGYLPEVEVAEVTEDEILVVMRKYLPLKRTDLDTSLIRKIADILAWIHTDSVPEFLLANVSEEKPLTGEEVMKSAEGWQNILAPWASVFDAEWITRISEKLMTIVSWHSLEGRALVHGDFHWENLLADEAGNVVVCDWQGVKRDVPSGDVSFFLSRLGADGVELEPDVFLKAYAEAREARSGEKVDVEQLRKHMAAANVITTFRYWHFFLQGSDEARIRGIYEKMIEDFRSLE